MAELLPCPFCGGEAVAKHGLSNFHDVQVYCNECFSCSGSYDVDDGEDCQPERNLQDATKHWNTRAFAHPSEQSIRQAAMAEAAHMVRDAACTISITSNALHIYKIDDVVLIASELAKRIEDAK